MATSRSIRLRSPWVLALLLSAATGCDDGIPSSGPGETIPEEVFIEAMVDLRAEALMRPAERLLPGEAEAVLVPHGVVADDLRRFVEVHGRNVPMMSEVWAEVERRVEALSHPELAEPSGDP